MKDEEIFKYRDMCMRIKSKLNDIHAHLPYGLSRDERAFLECVDELVGDLKKL